MQIKITGKELKVTDAINDYVERKMERVDKYFEHAEADVTIKVEKAVQIAEMKVSANGEMFRAVTEDKDLYASIDKDIDILEGQIRKVKTKKERLLKTANVEMPSVDTDVFAEGEVTKVKTFSPKPMTVEDVILEIKDSDKMFYVFNNSDTNETNVLFKLKDGNYGILEPEK